MSHPLLTLLVLNSRILTFPVGSLLYSLKKQCEHTVCWFCYSSCIEMVFDLHLSNMHHKKRAKKETVI